MKRYIAIKGNSKKGSEIIKLLEMMGGNNIKCCTGLDSSKYYFIDNGTKYICNENIYEMEECYNGVYMLFSYDIFNDNYPWRIGDIVNVIGRNDRIGLKVVTMQWGDAYNTMMYCLDCGEDGYGWWRAEDIQYTRYSDFKVDLNNTVNNNIEFDLTKYSYEVKDRKLIIEKKKLKYPTNYKECCDVLGLNTMDNDAKGYKHFLVIQFQELLIARDAYWKIAGEELGLSKPWEPDWNWREYKFCIGTICDKIEKFNVGCQNCVLAFPTDEIRDAFYENFKDLIEQCKELL